MVLFQGNQDTNWTAPLSFHEYLQVPEEFAPYLPQFHYALLDLKNLNEQELKGEVLLQLSLLMMKHIDDPQIHAFFFETLFPGKSIFVSESHSWKTFQNLIPYCSVSISLPCIYLVDYLIQSTPRPHLFALPWVEGKLVFARVYKGFLETVGFPV